MNKKLEQLYRTVFPANVCPSEEEILDGLLKWALELEETQTQQESKQSLQKKLFD